MSIGVLLTAHSARGDNGKSLESLKTLCGRIAGVEADILTKDGVIVHRDTDAARYLDIASIACVQYTWDDMLFITVAPDFSVVYEIECRKASPMSRPYSEEEKGAFFDDILPLLRWNGLSERISDYDTSTTHRTSMFSQFSCRGRIYRGACISFFGEGVGNLESFTYLPPIDPKESASPALSKSVLDKLFIEYRESIQKSLRNKARLVISETPPVSTVMAPIDRLMSRMLGDGSAGKEFYFCTEIEATVQGVPSGTIYGTVLIGFSNNGSRHIYTEGKERERLNAYRFCPAGGRSLENTKDNRMVVGLSFLEN